MDQAEAKGCNEQDAAAVARRFVSFAERGSLQVTPGKQGDAKVGEHFVTRSQPERERDDAHCCGEQARDAGQQIDSAIP